MVDPPPESDNMSQAVLLCQERPDVLLTYLLALPLSLSKHDYNIASRIRHLQNMHRGVERIRVHLPISDSELMPAQNHRRYERIFRSSCVPRRLPKRTHSDCSLHRFLWAPQDSRVYVELRAWGAGWAALAIRAILRLDAPFGPVEQVWLVLRWGVAAWLCSRGNVDGLSNQAVTLARTLGSIDFGFRCGLSNLPCSSGWGLLEFHWASGRQDESLSELQRFGSEVEKAAASLLVAQVCWSCGALDAVVGTRWEHQSTGAFEEIEERRVVLMVIFSPRMRKRAPELNRLGVVGSDLGLIQDLAQQLARLPEHMRWDSRLPPMTGDASRFVNLRICDLEFVAAETLQSLFLQDDGRQAMEDLDIDIITYKKRCWGPDGVVAFTLGPRPGYNLRCFFVLVFRLYWG